MGSTVGVSLGIVVAVAGGGVGEYAATVWVSISDAICAAIVPTTSTGGGVGSTAQADKTRTIASANTVGYDDMITPVIPERISGVKRDERQSWI